MVGKQSDPFRHKNERQAAGPERDPAVRPTEYRQGEQTGVRQKSEAEEKERLAGERWNGREPERKSQSRDPGDNGGSSSPAFCGLLLRSCFESLAVASHPLQPD